MLPYSVAQLAGAFVASAVVFLTYHEALDAFDGGVRQVLGAQGTAGIWATYPQPFLSTFPGGFIDQVVGTALLVGVHLRHHRQPQLAGAGRARAGRRRPARRADRRDVRLQLRLRDQPGARFRSAAVHVRRRLGRRGVPRRRTTGGGCRSSRRSIGGVAGAAAYDFFVGDRFPAQHVVAIAAKAHATSDLL